MNFTGLWKVLVFAISILATLVIGPALVLGPCTSPTVVICVCTGIGIAVGVKLKDLSWSIMMGCAGLVASLTVLYVSAALGGGLFGWSLAFLASVFSTTTTIIVAMLVMPKNTKF